MRQARLVRAIHGRRTLIQAEGITVATGGSPASGVRGLALAQALLASTAAYVLVAGGTTCWTRNLADLLGIPVHGIASGWFARTLVEGMRAGGPDGRSLATAVRAARCLACQARGCPAVTYSRALAALLPFASGHGRAASGPPLVKLNQNESPFELAPEERALLLAELRAVPLHRYPDPGQAALAERVAVTAGVTPDMVLAGNGANEPLELLIRCCCDPGDQMLTAAPTYHLHDRFAAMNRAELVKVDWGEGFALPWERLLRAAGPRARLILLCRPNNPTGHLFPADRVLALADRFAGTVAVDEAYYDFCRDSLAPWVGPVSNLVVVRTLSKAYGAAGLRLEYLLAAAPVVRAVRAMQPPYGTSAWTQAAACFLLARDDLLERQRAVILRNRADLAACLAGIAGLTAFPAHAHFLLWCAPPSPPRPSSVA